MEANVLFLFRLFKRIPRFFSKNMTKVEGKTSLEAKAQEAEALVNELKTELNQLKNVVNAIKAAGSNATFSTSYQSLIQENETLKKEIQRYKEQLTGRVSNASVLLSANNGGASDSLQLPPEKPPSASTEEKIAPAGKKEKPAKEKKPSEKKDASATEEPPIDVGRLDFRVGKIIDVKKHPDADSLYVEQIDLGEGKPRTVVSGLVKHVPIEEMANRMVIVLCNLKPAKMRGVTSEGMVMCASADQVEILLPPAGSAPGDIVEIEGFPRVPDPVLNPKKKIFETVAPDLKTDSSKVATYKGVPWKVHGKGIVTTTSLAGVNIK